VTLVFCKLRASSVTAEVAGSSPVVRRRFQKTYLGSAGSIGVQKSHKNVPRSHPNFTVPSI